MLRVFCDFDGTIAASDVGNRLFCTFGGEAVEKIVEKYLNDEITARECLQLECAAIENVTREELLKFADGCELDPYFSEFVKFCAGHEIPVTILSDGLDLYVERILKNHHLSHLVWFANHAEFVRDGSKTKLVPSFPYRDAECERCGNCKRNHLLTMSGDDDVIVYVGDGISDRCPVRYADIVFAKHDLIPYCQSQNISYHDYQHFGNVRERLAQLLEQKRLRTRREAAMARREVFMQG